MVSSSSSREEYCDTFSSLTTDPSITILTPTSTPLQQKSAAPHLGPEEAVFSFLRQDHTKTLLVRSLGPDACPSYIKNLFLPFGFIKSLRVLWERDVDTIASIEFEQQRFAENAMSDIERVTKNNWQDRFGNATPPQPATPSRSPAPDQAVFSFPNHDHTKTLLVRSLGPDVAPNYIRNLFQPYGFIKGMRLIWERDVDTIAFIEYEDQHSAEKAMSDIDRVTERNWKDRYATRKEVSSGSGEGKDDKGKGLFTVFVGDTGDLTEEDLSEAFEPFGMIRKVLLVRDMETGCSKKFAFVTYADKASARDAIRKMNGTTVKNTTIVVAWDHGGRMTKRKKTRVEKDDELKRQREYDKISKEARADNSTIFVGYRQGILSQQLLRQKFGPFGKITDLKCYKEKGYGFLRFQERSSAIHAIYENNGMKTKNGGVFKVGWAKPL